jgi:hypothetical protein
MPSVAKHPWRIGNHLGVSDTELDCAESGDLQVRACSIRGLEHRLHQTTRQDSFSVGATPDGGVLVMAVADGLGSASHSHEGSAAVARSAVATLIAAAVGPAPDWTKEMGGAIEAASAALKLRACALELPARALASTLVLAVVSTELMAGTYAVTLGRVGDSSALWIKDGQLSDVFPPKDDGEVQVSATACLPVNPDLLETLTMQLHPGQALVLATDGFHVPAMTATWGPYFGAKWAEAPGVDSLLGDLHFLARTYDDDRTVAGFWGPPKGIEEVPPR